MELPAQVGLRGGVQFMLYWMCEDWSGECHMERLGDHFAYTSLVQAYNDNRGKKDKCLKSLWVWQKFVVCGGAKTLLEYRDMEGNEGKPCIFNGKDATILENYGKIVKNDEFSFKISKFVDLAGRLRYNWLREPTTFLMYAEDDLEGFATRLWLERPWRNTPMDFMEFRARHIKKSMALVHKTYRKDPKLIKILCNHVNRKTGQVDGKWVLLEGPQNRVWIPFHLMLKNLEWARKMMGMSLHFQPTTAESGIIHKRRQLALAQAQAQ
tara:strand:- start:565 stop:1365 length:801 start_codon:yes stop_codon:yes gene_type:complete